MDSDLFLAILAMDSYNRGSTKDWDILAAN